MAFWDDLLNEIDEADREVLQKYPDLAAKVNKNDEVLNEWETWKAKEYDPATGYTKRALEAIRQRDTEIEALKLLQGNDMTWDEMKGNVEKLISDTLTSKNVVDKSNLDATLGNRMTIKVKQGDGSDKEIPVTDYVRNVERGMEVIYNKTNHFPMKYWKEFGNFKYQNAEGKEVEPPDFTQEDLWKHMQQNQIADFEKGYESFVAPLRAKKQEIASRTHDEQIRLEERNKVKAEFQQRNGGIMPDDTKGSAPEMSALSRKIADRKKVEVTGPKLTPGTIGDGSAGNDAYQQWLKDQSSGTKPTFPTGMIQ